MVGFHLVEKAPAFCELRSAMEQGNHVHAYLITGERGVGKRSFARFAAAMLIGGHYPDSCKDCRRVLHNIHPDLHIISAEGKQIGVEQVRQIISDCSIQPFEAEKKVFIIEQAERMTPAAQNSLLKILEEPPLSTVFFLTAQSVKSVLPTVVSRCQVLRMDSSHPDHLTKELTDQYPVSQTDAAVYARHSGGNMAKALQFMGKSDYLSVRDTVAKAVGSLLNGSDLEALTALNTLKGQEELLFDALCAWIRDLISIAADRQGLVNIDCEDMLRTQAEKASISQLNGMLSACIRAENRLSQNTAFQSIMDALVIDMRKQLKGSDK